jgi:hypothetical protein
MSDLPKGDKRIIEQLEFCDNYAAAFRLKELKKQNTNLKRELTKLKKRQANEANKPDAAALRIESVSGSLPNDKTIEFLFENGAHAPFYSDILEEVGHAGYHFINGAMRNIMLASNDR